MPTGIGASIGGFAGDANPVALKMAKKSDYLITHPNVVNGATLTKISDNTLLVEGYLLDQFFLNKVALRPKIEHKIAVIVDSDISQKEKEIVQNAVNAGRAFYGLDLLDIIWTEEAVGVQVQSPESMALGDMAQAIEECQIDNMQTIFDACEEAIKKGATALAVMAKIPDPPETNESKNYSEGKGYDPIGLVEAKISHLVAQKFMIPCAHAPILDPPICEAILSEAVVHPKASAEYLGFSFLPSVLQCLNHSAGIILLDDELKFKFEERSLKSFDGLIETNFNLKSDDIFISDLSNLLVPYDSCDGIPMHEAAKHNIELISIKENQTILNKTAKSLGLEAKLVESYDEALELCEVKKVELAH